MHTLLAAGTHVCCFLLNSLRDSNLAPLWKKEILPCRQVALTLLYFGARGEHGKSWVRRRPRVPSWAGLGIFVWLEAESTVSSLWPSLPYLFSVKAMRSILGIVRTCSFLNPSLLLHCSFHFLFCLPGILILMIMTITSSQIIFCVAGMHIILCKPRCKSVWYDYYSYLRWQTWGYICLGSRVNKVRFKTQVLLTPKPVFL